MGQTATLSRTPADQAPNLAALANYQTSQRSRFLGSLTDDQNDALCDRATALGVEWAEALSKEFGPFSAQVRSELEGKLEDTAFEHLIGEAIKAGEP